MKKFNFKRNMCFVFVFLIVLSSSLVSVCAAECSHSDYTVRYESLSTDSHRVICTCSSCGHVWSNTKGCSLSPKKTVASPLTDSTHYAEIRCGDCNNILEIRKSEACYYVINGDTCVCGKRDPEGCSHPKYETRVVWASGKAHYVIKTCVECLHKTSETKACTTKKTVATSLTAKTHSTEIRCADCNGLLESRASEDCYFVIDDVSCVCGNFIFEDLQDNAELQPTNKFLPIIIVSSLGTLLLVVAFVVFKTKKKS